MLDAGGVPRMYLSLHKYIVTSIPFLGTKFASIRAWSSTIQTVSFVPLKFLFTSVDSANSIMSGYGQDPLQKSMILFYYIP